MPQQWLETSTSIDQLPTKVVSLSSLLPGDSPRLKGVSSQHTATLAEMDVPLPPLLVHGHTMRVIDGMHRLQAAKRRGQQEIEVRIFDGDEDAAFVLAVQLNITHGLPLSLPDRRAAARRIVSTHPTWSDRAIASRTGLSAATVANIRRSTVQLPQSNKRVGRDGRARPLSAVEGRRRAGALIAHNPEVPLREVAREAGISASTAHDVRQRVMRGLDPVPVSELRQSRRGNDMIPSRRSSHRGAQSHNEPKEPEIILQKLLGDPSLRFTDAGRVLLAWVDRRARGIDTWMQLLTNIPPHCTKPLGELARACEARWANFAQEMEIRSKAAG